MVVPCMVKIWLYMSALRKVLSGVPSCQRSSMASKPPSRKNSPAVRAYIRPIFLWSTVVIHPHRPFGVPVGRAEQLDRRRA